MDLISIIVPVYQVEKYLEECVNSIINQTYKIIEIILIDDGSTDASGSICDDYAKRNDKIIVVHQQNKGLSGARNVGLDLAKGKYICFVDSDDYIHEDFINILYKMIKEKNAEIAICDYTRDNFWNDSNIKNDGEYVLTSHKMLSEWHGRRTRIETVVWNKLYHRDIFGGRSNCKIRFPEGKIHEDVYTSHLMIANANRIAITNKKLYCYRKNSSSITNSKKSVKRKQMRLDAQYSRLLFFKNNKYYRPYYFMKSIYLAYKYLNI